MNPLQGIDFGALVMLTYNHEQLSEQQIQQLKDQVFAGASEKEIKKLEELLTQIEHN